MKWIDLIIKQFKDSDDIEILQERYEMIGFNKNVLKILKDLTEEKKIDDVLKYRIEIVKKLTDIRVENSASMCLYLGYLLKDEKYIEYIVDQSFGEFKFKTLRVLWFISFVLDNIRFFNPNSEIPATIDALKILPLISKNIDKNGAGRIAQKLYSYRRNFKFDFDDRFKGTMKQRNESRRKIREERKQAMIKFKNAVGRESLVLNEYFKQFQVRANTSILDLKYCMNKEDIIGDPLDEKNEITIFQRMKTDLVYEKDSKEDSKEHGDIKKHKIVTHNQILSECMPSENAIEISMTSNKVFRWKGKKNSPDTCCASENEQVFKLPSGMWILASRILLQTFKYFILISLGYQKIGSSFGVSALHNATEHLWRAVPVHLSDIQENFNKGKIENVQYTLKVTSPDLTIKDPMGFVESLLENKSIEIHMKADGRFMWLHKDNIGLMEKVLDTDESEKDLDREVSQNRNRIKREREKLSRDECEDKDDCTGNDVCSDGQCFDLEERIDYDNEVDY